MIIKRKDKDKTKTKNLVTFKGLKKILFRQTVYTNAGISQENAKRFNLDSYVDALFETGPEGSDSPTYIISITLQSSEKILDAFLGTGGN